MGFRSLGRNIPPCWQRLFAARYRELFAIAFSLLLGGGAVLVASDHV